MNIFLLDESPDLAARWQHDRHVVKMILESAQMLSTACHSGMFPVELPDALYKPTHANHPCNVWLRESMSNVAWLTAHLDSLIAEYHFRFQKRHATDTLRWLFLGAVTRHFDIARSHVKIDGISRLNPAILSLAAGHTPFVYCGNSYFLGMFANQVVPAYRAMYAVEKCAQDHVKWTNRFVPDFLLAIDHRFPLIVRNRITDLTRKNASQHVCAIPDRLASKPARVSIESPVRIATPVAQPTIKFSIR